MPDEVKPTETKPAVEADHTSSDARTYRRDKTGKPDETGQAPAETEDFNEWREASEADATKPVADKAAGKDAAKTAGEPEPPKQTQESEEDEDDEPESGDATKPRRKGGFRRTIDKLNRRNDELAQKVADLEARLATPKGEVPAKPAADKQPDEDKMPVEEDYPDDYTTYVRAISRWESR